MEPPAAATSGCTIAIVGGGFCGTVLAALLLRRLTQGTVRVLLVERQQAIGRGAAYAERDYPYLLNVPVGRMSADPDDPEHFLRFARQRDPRATADDFLPRAFYGEYLGEFLASARSAARPGIELQLLHGAVESLSRDQEGRHWRLQLEDGRTLRADAVALATGNPAPATPAVLESLVDTPHFVDDPWKASARLAGVDKVLLLGTGLTMVDVVTAASVGASGPRVFHALSRHGLMAPRQTAFRADALRADGTSRLMNASPSPRRLVRELRRLARDAEYAGGDWREAMNLARLLAPALWERMEHDERRRFLRHARSYWDIHRHRLPMENLARIDDLQGIGRLRIHAGRIVCAVPRENKVEIRWRPRGEDTERTLYVDRVVNCTGPDYDLKRSRDPLLSFLVRTGYVKPDALGLGLHTSSDCAVIGADGTPTSHLYYVGPMLRADHWEATAAAELRDFANRTASAIAQTVR